MGKLTLYLCSLWCIFFFAGFSNVKNQGGQITLRDEKLNLLPRKFYIVNVADERVNKNSIASLIEKDKHAPIEVDLKNGAVEAIKKFLHNNLHRDTTLRPVMLTIKELKLTETSLPNSMVSGHFKVIFSFSGQLSYQTVHLVDYSGEIHYQRADNKPADVESIIRHGIENGLSYFNKWINERDNKHSEK